MFWVIMDDCGIDEALEQPVVVLGNPIMCAMDGYLGEEVVDARGGWAFIGD